MHLEILLILQMLGIVLMVKLFDILFLSSMSLSILYLLVLFCFFVFREEWSNL